MLGRDFREAFAIRVEGADATDPVHPREDASVMAAEVAGADDCGSEIGVCHETQDNTAGSGVQFSGGRDRKKE
jgi:hypothetical protein